MSLTKPVFKTCKGQRPCFHLVNKALAVPESPQAYCLIHRTHSPLMIQKCLQNDSNINFVILSLRFCWVLLRFVIWVSSLNHILQMSTRLTKCYSQHLSGQTGYQQSSAHFFQLNSALHGSTQKHKLISIVKKKKKKKKWRPLDNQLHSSAPICPAYCCDINTRIWLLSGPAYSLLQGPDE